MTRYRIVRTSLTFVPRKERRNKFTFWRDCDSSKCILNPAYSSGRHSLLSMLIWIRIPLFPSCWCNASGGRYTPSPLHDRRRKRDAWGWPLSACSRNERWNWKWAYLFFLSYTVTTLSRWTPPRQNHRFTNPKQNFTFYWKSLMTKTAGLAQFIPVTRIRSCN